MIERRTNDVALVDAVAILRDLVESQEAIVESRRDRGVAGYAATLTFEEYDALVLVLAGFAR